MDITATGADLSLSGKWGAFAFGGLTNLIFLYPSARLYQKNLIFESIFVLCVAVTSFLYHTSDSFNIEIVGMMMPAWNEIDDIFASSFGVATFLILWNHARYHSYVRLTSVISPLLREINISIIGISFALAVIWNQVAPVSSASIAGPMAIGLMLSLISVCSNGSFFPQFWAITSHRVKLFFFLLFGAGAIVFYFISQPRNNDYLRWKHGCWHLCIGISLSCAVQMCGVYPLISHWDIYISTLPKYFYYYYGDSPLYTILPLHNVNKPKKISFR